MERLKEGYNRLHAMCHNCNQVKIEHLKPRGITQEINIATWMWEVINMEFIRVLPHNRR